MYSAITQVYKSNFDALRKMKNEIDENAT